VGAGILGWTAGKMLIEDKLLAPFFDFAILHYLIPTLTTLMVVVIGKWWSNRQNPVET
jgi:predicted tellurium resistance membrane protein TerC